MRHPMGLTISTLNRQNPQRDPPFARTVPARLCAPSSPSAKNNRSSSTDARNSITFPPRDRVNQFELSAFLHGVIPNGRVFQRAEGSRVDNTMRNRRSFAPPKKRLRSG